MIESFNWIAAETGGVDLGRAGLRAPSATWTYLINDDPFADKFEMQFIGDVGFFAWAGIAWPFTVLYLLVKRLRIPAGAGGEATVLEFCRKRWVPDPREPIQERFSSSPASPKVRHSCRR